jgi:nitrite reductase/ring-hydroxylating ferredoxin subunit
MVEAEASVADVFASQAVALCQSEALRNSSEAVPFDVVYCGQSCLAFAIRYDGRVYAYLNRCSHVPMEMDYQPNRFFDLTGLWLICATHGATYSPKTGECRGGPCRGGLVKIETSERDGVVHWHTAQQLQPVNF